MRRKLDLLVLLATLPVIAGGETQHTYLEVSAHVPPQVRLDASQAPTSFWLDAADVARGFKEVEARYMVMSNLPRGYLLRFHVREGLAREIEVLGLGAPMSVGPLGGEVRRDRPGPREGGLTLKYRLHVDAHLPPGRYPLPVAVSAEPL